MPSLLIPFWTSNPCNLTCAWVRGNAISLREETQYIHYVYLDIPHHQTLLRKPSTRHPHNPSRTIQTPCHIQLASILCFSSPSRLLSPCPPNQPAPFHLSAPLIFRLAPPALNPSRPVLCPGLLSKPPLSTSSSRNPTLLFLLCTLLFRRSPDACELLLWCVSVLRMRLSRARICATSSPRSSLRMRALRFEGGVV